MAEAWPPISVAARLLPTIRRALLAHARAARSLPGPPIDLCAIVEDGVLGYELAPHVAGMAFLILGCTADATPRLRRTSFDPSSDPRLRLATSYGRNVRFGRSRGRRGPRSAEVLYADWDTAAAQAWMALDPALDHSGTQWDTSMAVCRSLENALAVASLHLAEWDPAVDFCGLVHQAEYGFPLRGRDSGTGTLTLRHSDLWHLTWRCGTSTIDIELSHSIEAPGTPTLLPRNCSG